MTPLVCKGWELLATHEFHHQLDNLTADTELLLERLGPVELQRHPKYKLLIAIRDNILERVPENPDAPQYRLGTTLPKKFSNWRRVKKNSLPDRYRLFFQFSSTPQKRIIFAWINNDETLRQAGAKTDVYAVFQKMLERGHPPTHWAELLKAAAAFMHAPEEHATEETTSHV
jgi:toxin YhaV